MQLHIMQADHAPSSKQCAVLMMRMVYSFLLPNEPMKPTGNASSAWLRAHLLLIVDIRGRRE